MELVGYGHGKYLKSLILDKPGVELREIKGTAFYVSGSEAWVWPAMGEAFGATYTAVLFAVLYERLQVHSVPTTIAAKMHLRTSRRVSKKLETGEVVYSRPAKGKTETGGYLIGAARASEWVHVTEYSGELRHNSEGGFEPDEWREASWWRAACPGELSIFVHGPTKAVAVASQEDGCVPRLLFCDLAYNLDAPYVFAALCETLLGHYSADSVLLGSVGSNNHTYSRRIKVHCLRAFLSYSTLIPV